MKLTKSNFGPQGWWVTIYSFLCWTVAALLKDGMNVLYGFYGGAYGWDRTAMAAYVSAGVWVSVAGILICGIFAKKLGAKNMLIIGFAVNIISTIALIFSETLAIWGVAFIIYELGGGIITGFGVQLLGSNWFPRKKGLFMGWATMGVILASSAVNGILSVSLETIGIRTFYWILAAVYAAMLLLAVLFIRNYPEDVGAFPDNDKTFSREEQAKMLALGEEYKKTSPWTVKNILKDGNTWLIILGWGFMNLCMNGVFGQIVPAFVSFGHGANTGVLLLTWSFPVGFAFSYLGGLWDAKWGTKHASRWMCCGMNILGCVLLGFFGSNLICAVIGIWLFMGANAAGNNMTMSVASSRYGRYDFANGWAVISVATRLVSGAGAVVTSAAADIAGGYQGAFLILLGITVVAFIFMSFASDKCVGRTEDEIEAQLKQLKTGGSAAQ